MVRRRSYVFAVTLNRGANAAKETTYADSNPSATPATRSLWIAVARESHKKRRRGVACLRANRDYRVVRTTL